ncbi:MAG: MFS transporter [Deltaproteobacteria bacterium]|nr:MFS transporter [Deltaproteobacteria bacterium]
MPPSAFHSLRHRDFRRFWAGQGVSLAGTHMARVAVAWQLYELTHDPVQLGLLGAAKLLPVLLLSLPGGVLADRFDRRWLLFGATAVLAVGSSLLWWCTTAGTLTPWILYAVVALQSAAGAVGGPARQAMIPNLVPVRDLQPAITLVMLTWDVTGVAGPALGGIALAHAGAAAIHLFDAVSYLVVMGALASLAPHPPQRDATPHEAPLAAMAAGIRWVASQPLIRASMLLDFFATLFGQATVLFPILAAEVLHVDETGLGLLYAAPALGSVLAGLVLSVSPPLVAQGRWLIASVAVYGLATVAFGLSASFLLTLGALAVVGASDTVSTVLRQTLRQRVTPDAMRGRMTGVNMLFFMGGPQLGELESGLGAAWLGAPLAIAAGGAGVLITVAVAVARVPALWHYRDAPAD